MTYAEQRYMDTHKPIMGFDFDTIMGFDFDIRFSYPKPGMCVSTVEIAEQLTGQLLTGQLLTLEGTSKCHPDDQFVKSQGRIMALRRSTAKLDQYVIRSKFRSALKRRIWRGYFDRTFQPTLYIDKSVVEEAINAKY